MAVATRTLWVVLIMAVFLGGCNQAPEPTKAPSDPLPRKVYVDFAPLPFPGQPSGLSFQRGAAPEGGMLTRPLGSAHIDKRGHIWLSFPEQNLVVRFKAPQWEAHFFGPERVGGKDEPLIAPYSMTDYGDGIIVASQSNGVLTPLMANKPELTSPSPDPVMVDGGFFAYTDGQWQLHDLKGGSSQGFGGETNAQALVHGNELGNVLFYNPAIQQLRFYKHGKSDVLQLPKGLGKTNESYRVASILSVKNLAWVLVRTNKGTQIIVIDSLGTVHHYWQLSHAADGMFLSQSILVLFDRDKGMAQRYTWAGR